MTWEVRQGDVLARLGELPSESIHCCVTSPPYWGLRDYGVDGQIGLEATPEEFVAKMVQVFREVRRVLRANGTLWLNMGDSYAGSRSGPEGDLVGLDGSRRNQEASRAAKRAMTVSRRRDDEPIPRSDVRITGVKPKDLVGMPWMVAFALRADGWYLRQDIIWAKPNPMPESVRDRCTKSHEYLFLLAQSDRYYYDGDAIRTPFSAETKAQSFETMDFAARVRYKKPDGWDPGSGSHGSIHRNGREKGSAASVDYIPPAGANKRTVWTVPTEGFPDAHFATFPTELVRPCILAGCPVGGTVLDPAPPGWWLCAMVATTSASS